MRTTTIRRCRVFFIPALVLGLSMGSSQVLANHSPAKIHMEIVSAPVVPNGLVASEPTEFNVLVRRDGTDPATAMDNEEPIKGLQIPEGGKMEVELEGFVPNPDLAGFSAGGANIILTTGPQNPIKPNAEAVSGGQWSASLTSNNVITVTPNAIGGGADGLAGTRAAVLGFKVVHVRPRAVGGARSHEGTPFYNGLPGRIGTVYVRIYDANHVVAAGSVSVRFMPRVGKQVHLTNAMARDDDSINSNTNFQHVSPGTTMDGKEIPSGGSFMDGAPYAPQFLIFADTGVHDQNQYPTGDALPEPNGDSFIPFLGIDGVTVVPSNGNPSKAQLVRYGTSVVGHVVLKGPTKKSGGNIIENDMPTTASGNGSVLYVPVRVGTETGLYTVTVYMNGGGSATNTIVVK